MRSVSARWTEAIDEQAVRDFVARWFVALGNRDAEALIEMTTPDVAIRPFLARQPVQAVGYYGHDGIRDWVTSLDSHMEISLNLISAESSGPQSAVVEAEVFFDREGGRTGGITFSLWRFRNGKLAEAIGYGTKEDALDAERGSWH